MSGTAALIKLGTGTLSGFIKNLHDPDKRRALDAAVIEYVLSELPRLHRLIAEREEEIRASGCTPEESKIITYQVLDEQKRTLDDEKRRRLSNVLINGLCREHWDKATHRLMVRLTSELEEEHVERLQREVPNRARSASFAKERMEAALGDAEEMKYPAEERERRRVLRERERARNYELETDARAARQAIERELISRGLLHEETKPVPNSAWKPAPAPAYDPRTLKPKADTSHLRGAARVPEFVDQTTIRISQLGRSFLEHLQDPESRDDEEVEGKPSTTSSPRKKPRSKP